MFRAWSKKRGLNGAGAELRVTLDANIWVSAFNFRGAAQRVLDMAEDGVIELVTSEAIIEEVLDVLGRKFDWSAPELKMARRRMSEYAQIVAPIQTITEITEDPDDDRILECAVAAASNVILTRDKDLLRREAYEGIRIVTMAEFFAWRREM